MRTSDFVVVIFVSLWGCVLTQYRADNFTETITLDDAKLGEFLATEKTEEDGTGVDKLDESKRNLTAESLIDSIVDLAIKHIREKTTGPIKLSDEKFLLVPIKGEVILYNGLLNGVNTISRAGKTTYNTHSGHIIVNTTIEFEELKFIYDFQSNIYKISADGVCKGAVTKLLVSVEFQLKITDREIELTGLKLVTAKTLTIQLDSSKFKDRVLNYILKTFTTIFKTILLSQLEKELQSYIGTVIHIGAASSQH
ncbi:uncharacterized protein LOC135838320 isoform X2 [Planococcus citri]|uniref:uncharacterized protein LOC135838320 isoform X2 n=1 Tax=Planococcus citri TaxID=170843 RepID=UPI0031F8041F